MRLRKKPWIEEAMKEMVIVREAIKRDRKLTGFWGILSTQNLPRKRMAKGGRLLWLPPMMAWCIFLMQQMVPS